MPLLSVQLDTPGWLALLWPLPVLVWCGLLLVRRRRARAASWMSEPAQRRVGVDPDRAARERRRGLMFCSAALLFGVLALAGPRWGYAWEEVRGEGVNLVVALDVSASMSAKDPAPSRWAVARSMIMELAEEFPDDRMGLVVFSGAAFRRCPLTLDRGAFRLFLDESRPGSLPVAGTDLAAAIDEGLRALEGQAAGSRVLVLISDGEDHGEALEQAVARAAEQEVRILAVGLGTPSGAPVPAEEGGFMEAGGRRVMSALNEAGLQRAALETGGAYLRAASPGADLSEVYKQRVRSRLERVSHESQRRKVWTERYQWPLAACIGCFLLSLPGLVPRRGGSHRQRRKPTGRGGMGNAGGRGELAALLLFAAGPLLASCDGRVTEELNAPWWRESPGPAAVAWGHLKAGDPEAEADWEPALEAYLQARVQGDDSTETRYGTALAALHTGRTALAFHELDRLAGVDPDPDTVRALHGRARALVASARLAEAVSALEQLSAAAPDNEAVKADLEWTRAELERRRRQALQQEEQRRQEQQQQQQQQQQQEAQEQEQEQQQDGEQQEQQQAGQEGEQQDGEQGARPQDGEQQPDGEQQRGQQPDGQEQDGQQQQQAGQDGQHDGEQQPPQAANSQGEPGDPREGELGANPRAGDEAEGEQPDGAAAPADVRVLTPEEAARMLEGVEENRPAPSDGSGKRKKTPGGKAW